MKYFIAKEKWSATGGKGTGEGGIRRASRPASGPMMLGIGKSFRGNSLESQKVTKSLRDGTKEGRLFVLNLKHK